MNPCSVYDILEWGKIRNNDYDKQTRRYVGGRLARMVRILELVDVDYDIWIQRFFLDFRSRALRSRILNHAGVLIAYQ